MTIASKQRELEYAKKLLELERTIADLVLRVASLEKARPLLKLKDRPNENDGRSANLSD